MSGIESVIFDVKRPSLDGVQMQDALKAGWITNEDGKYIYFFVFRCPLLEPLCAVYFALLNYFKCDKRIVFSM